MPKTTLWILTEAGKDRIARAQIRTHFSNEALRDEANLRETTFYKMLRPQAVSKRMILKLFKALEIKDAKMGVHYLLAVPSAPATDPREEGEDADTDSEASVPVEASQAEFALPYELSCFQGREKELRTLRAGFLKGERKQSIRGLGGIGKTQLALKYALKFQREYKPVLWVHADTEASVRSRYADIARRLGLVKDDTLN